MPAVVDTPLPANTLTPPPSLGPPSQQQSPPHPAPEQQPEQQQHQQQQPDIKTKASEQGHVLDSDDPASAFECNICLEVFLWVLMGGLGERAMLRKVSRALTLVPLSPPSWREILW